MNNNYSLVSCPKSTLLPKSSHSTHAHSLTRNHLMNSISTNEHKIGPWTYISSTSVQESTHEIEMSEWAQNQSLNMLYLHTHSRINPWNWNQSIKTHLLHTHSKSKNKLKIKKTNSKSIHEHGTPALLHSCTHTQESAHEDGTFQTNTWNQSMNTMLLRTHNIHIHTQRGKESAHIQLHWWAEILEQSIKRTERMSRRWNETHIR